MFNHSPLTEKTAPLYAIQNYWRTNVLWNIFFEDYASIQKTVKKLNKTDDIKNIHQLLNQIYSFESKFLGESLSRLFFYFSPSEEYNPIIKTYLEFVNRLPYNDIPELKISKVPFHDELLRQLTIIKNMYKK